MNYDQFRLQLADELEPYVDTPLSWIDRHAEMLRRLARKHGATLLLEAVRQAAAAGPRRLDFFEQDSGRWLAQAEQGRRQAPAPAREPPVCPSCGSPRRLSWCQVCGAEEGATVEEIDECRRQWQLERQDPGAALAAREEVLGYFRRRLPWNR